MWLSAVPHFGLNLERFVSYFLNVYCHINFEDSSTNWPESTNQNKTIGTTVNVLKNWATTHGSKAKDYRFASSQILTSIFCSFAVLLCRSLGKNWLFSLQPRQPIVSCFALICWNVTMTDASGDNFLNGTVNTKYLLKLNCHSLNQIPLVILQWKITAIHMLWHTTRNPFPRFGRFLIHSCSSGSRFCFVYWIFKQRKVGFKELWSFHCLYDFQCVCAVAAWCTVVSLMYQQMGKGNAFMGWMEAMEVCAGPPSLYSPVCCCRTRQILCLRL